MKLTPAEVFAGIDTSVSGEDYIHLQKHVKALSETVSPSKEGLGPLLDVDTLKRLFKPKG